MVKICLWKKSYIEEETTFINWHHWKEGHSLLKCVYCTDYTDDSQCENYRYLPPAGKNKRINTS